MEGPLPFNSLLAGTDGGIVHDKVPEYYGSFSKLNGAGRWQALRVHICHFSKVHVHLYTYIHIIIIIMYIVSLIFIVAVIIIIII